jgi:hypothetical protein
MAYPLVKAKTWKQLLSELAAHEVEFKKTGPHLTDPQGVASSVTYLERTYGIETYRYVVQPFGDDDMIMPSVIRSICSALHLDLADFGFDVEGPNPVN